MTEENIVEFKSKFEALVNQFDIPYFFAIAFYRNSDNELQAMQIKECRTKDITTLLAGELSFNSALFSLKANSGGVIISNEHKVTTTENPTD